MNRDQARAGIPLRQNRPPHHIKQQKPDRKNCIAIDFAYHLSATYNQIIPQDSEPQSYVISAGTGSAEDGSKRRIRLNFCSKESVNYYFPEDCFNVWLRSRTTEV